MLYDHSLYLRTLSEFTRVLLTPYDVHVVLDQLATRVTEVLGLLGSGVSLAEGDRLAFDAGVGGPVTVLERLQEATQIGPCVTAFRSGQVVTVSDLGGENERWPAYCRTARALGVQAVASIPMRLGDQAVGAMDLYAAESRTWDEDDMSAAVVMADMATAYLINASQHRQQVELAEQPQHALDARVVIEQAKGMIAGKAGITPDAAFDQLRRHARGRGATVRAVAEAVVNLGLDLGT